jgi:AcrR family transcriptional regulator
VAQGSKHPPTATTSEPEPSGHRAPVALPPGPFERAPRRDAKRRRDPLTQEAIVDVALEVLDSEGLDGLSMRRVAEKLDTGPASLYWHVGSKDGLLDLIMDRVIGEQEIPAPDPGRWEEQLKDVMRTARATILGHRDIVRISIGRIPMGPNSLRYMEGLLAILRAGGVPEQLAVVGSTLMFSVVNGFTMDETGQGGDPPAGQPPDDQAAVMVRDYMASLPAGQFPNLRAVADHFAFADQDERFELLIDLFVDGLAQRAGD